MTYDILFLIDVYYKKVLHLLKWIINFLIFSMFFMFNWFMLNKVVVCSKSLIISILTLRISHCQI